MPQCLVYCFQRADVNGGMADMGVSQAELVEQRGEGGRKLPQYIAALSGNNQNLYIKYTFQSKVA